MYAPESLLGERRVEVYARSPRDAEAFGMKSWSLLGLQTNHDVFKWRPLVRGLHQVLSALGVRKACAPNVAAMSANIATSDILTDRIPLGGDTWLYRNKQVPLDGIFLEPGMAFVMSAAGCPLIIAEGKNAKQKTFVVAAHAGRDSLADRGAVLGKPTRKNISVVETIIDAFRLCDVPPDAVSMEMRYWIPATSFEHRFDHPEYGAYNWRLFGFLKERWPGCMSKSLHGMFLSLEHLFLEQAQAYGIRRVWAAEDHSLAKYPDLTHTRKVGEDRHSRNLYIVKRNA